MTIASTNCLHNTTKANAWVNYFTYASAKIKTNYHWNYKQGIHDVRI